MRIGLLGGSFNPPHAAHRAISLFAIKRLKLDRVWWLLTPGNPLKDTGGLHDLAERAEAARKSPMIPRIDISCLEAVIGVATLSTRSSICAAASPACAWSGSWALTISRSFIAGKTGGASPPRCRIAVIDRPPQSFRALAAPAAQALARYRLPENQAARLADHAGACLGFSHRHETELCLRPAFGTPTGAGG